MPRKTSAYNESDDAACCAATLADAIVAATTISTAHQAIGHVVSLDRSTVNESYVRIGWTDAPVDDCSESAGVVGAGHP